MNAFLLSVSMCSMFAQNIIGKYAGNTFLRTNKEIYRFNAFAYAVCVLLFAIMAIGSAVSLYSIAMGIAFGILTVLSGVYKLKALSTGPMSITILITTSSMLIPALSGVVLFDEELRIPNIAAMAVLIGFIVLSVASPKQQDGASARRRSVNTGWIVCCVVTFLSMGAIGVMQKVHQSSPHRDELFVFLTAAFLASLAVSSVVSCTGKATCTVCPRFVLLAVLSGVMTFTMNYLNLKLSGIIPSQIFFPVVNGGSIILSSVCSIVVFREKITVRQAVGLCGGLLCLIAICLL